MTNKGKFTVWELIHNKCFDCNKELIMKQIMARDYLVMCRNCERAILIKRPDDDFTTDYVV